MLWERLVSNPIFIQFGVVIRNGSKSKLIDLIFPSYLVFILAALLDSEKTFRISGSFKTFMGQSMSKFTKLGRDFSRTWICVSPSTRNKTKKKYTLFHGVWATMPATAAYALSKLTDVPFSMGAHAYDVFRTGGDWLLGLKITSASFIRTSSLSSAKRIKELGVTEDRIRLIRRGLAHWPNRKRFELVNDEHLEILSVGRMVEKRVT